MLWVPRHQRRLDAVNGIGNIHQDGKLDHHSHFRPLLIDCTSIVRLDRRTYSTSIDPLPTSCSILKPVPRLPIHCALFRSS